ncbi:coiled-coil domain-containing protein 84 isoform X1 [Neophocaena asiaeorientalis asiaeorientalis]|uniref:Coiled-coil domain-containing protein 84 isoform X1 n=1 Tax=Neophocaena asiaeorientalis asiaeorientalis TaxID=1706337 RepID=A0A341BY48_NEOAA|nr:coiled-coil domain-containing protein 84 isoform X1 [Neophocaena asiaeorientalis asiaeorientalis]
MAPAERCPVCRQTFFCGRGHVYSRKHQRQLKVALERLLPQVEAARKAVRAAQVERYVPEHERCCWCLCCGCEVRKHLSHGNLTVLHGGLLEHLASPEHKKATNRFWWENKAEFQMKEKFLISPQDYARFKKSMVKSLDSYEEKEDEVIKEMAAQIREVEHSRQEVVRSVLEPQTVPDPEEGSSAPGSWKGTNSQVASTSQQPSYVDLPPAPELDWMETGQPLTFIGHHQDTPGIGNIHSGATPPWMVQDEDCSSGNQQIGPSYEEFLKESKLTNSEIVMGSLSLPTQIKLLIVEEKQKLKKLPPDRVGANFDHNSSTGAGWLPSFGRVWNNGRRWQSRYGPSVRTPTHSPLEISPFVLLTLHFLSGINSKLKPQQETNSSHIKKKVNGFLIHFQPP